MKSKKSNTDQFYADLPVYDDMRCIIEPDRPQQVPADWYVIIADVISSTVAIENGQYREINTIGVSAIIAVLNITEGIEIPYVFGGDGATICVPESLLSRATEALSATIDMTRESFGLELRVGYLSVSEVLRNGASFKISRCRMSPHLVNAMLVGDGVAYVESVVKGEIRNSNYKEVYGSVGHQADYSGFECRWQEIPSRHGETISLLLKATASTGADETKTYTEILDLIEDIYGDESEHHPVDLAGLNLSFSAKKLSQEQNIRTYGRGAVYKALYAIKLLFQNILGTLLFSKLLAGVAKGWQCYKTELIRNTDYRKFDGMLKMIMAGTKVQREKLLIEFDEYESQKKIIYGIHVSNAAQITCLVNDRKQDHIHFVDGAGGGYTLAAMQFKKKLSGNVH
ncbi:MAG: DUF3095 domain-containing protein [Gammaproteobacteria bacterium]|nr:DUF3095 domain-containing protein [Gammaproteobacteria bacterium]